MCIRDRPPPHISPPGLPLLPRPHKSPAPVRFFCSRLSSSSSLISYAHAIYSPALLFESPDVPLNQSAPFAQHGLQRGHIGFVHARARTGTLGDGTARRPVSYTHLDVYKRQDKNGGISMDKRPNILWLCTDQQRWDTIHALGNSFIDTPNLCLLYTSRCV